MLSYKHYGSIVQLTYRMINISIPKNLAKIKFRSFWQEMIKNGK